MYICEKNSEGNYISNVFKLRHEQHWQNHLFPKKLIQECEVAGEQCGDPVAHTTSFVFSVYNYMTITIDK